MPADDPFIYSDAQLSIGGEFTHTFALNDFEMTVEMSVVPVTDPDIVAKLGGCPHCDVIPLSGEAHLCEHGVIPALEVSMTMTIEDPYLYACLTEWFA